MAQNRISLLLTQDQLNQADQALTALEDVLGGLISLAAIDRKRLHKMGQKSEVFCRQALSVLSQNPQIVPPSLDLTEAAADLRALDQLRPLLDRLERLAERGTDTEMALGSDIMDAALQGYALLKVSGRGQGLDSLRKELGSRWSKSRRSEDEPVADPA